MPTTTGMKGGGFYNSHSEGQRAALTAFLPWLEESIVQLPDSTEAVTAFSFLDIGSSEGANALYAMQRLAGALRRFSELPIWLFFNDLPTNDFNQLFTNLFPTASSSCFGRDVFPGCIAGTGFGRLVPSRSLHIATTFNAIGYLESQPDVALPNYVLPMQPGPRAPRADVWVTPAQQEAFQAQAAGDLVRFYSARAEELVAGGKLLVQVFGRTQEMSTSYGLYDVFSDAILDCIESGLLPRSVYENFVMPISMRTIEELIEPVKHGPLARSFRIERAESQEVPVAFNVALANNGDRAAWATSYTGFLRAFTERVLLNVLPQQSDRNSLLDRIYQQVERLLLANPDRYEFHYISVAALLTRI